MWIQDSEFATSLLPRHALMYSYSHIFLSDGRKILVSTHLMKLERRFGDKMVRVHRSYLVNPEADIEITEKEFTTPLGHKGLISRRLKKNLMF
jgi:DNA-binding LytR/AlgR family response regulator